MAALRKKNIPAAWLLAGPVALGLWATDRSWLGRVGRHADIRRLSNFGEPFDALWGQLRRAPGRLRAVRTAAALDWRFGDLLCKRQAAVLGLFQGERLEGYVILRETTREHLGLRQFVIADLQALDDSPDRVTALLQAALEATRHAGVDALEWQGWNSEKRKIAEKFYPRSYRYPTWPLFYKTVNPDIAPIMARPGSWDFSPFDAF
jgi:hypothetical protein